MDNLLCYINSINNNIQFTVEKEVDNTLPFLDINICKQSNGSLAFKVFRKQTSNDRYLDYHSHNPISHKINTVKALQRRAYTICSDETSKLNELEKVKVDLKNNGYPISLIKKCEKEITKPIYRDDNDDQNINICVPYIKGVTERTSKILKNYNINLYSKNANTLKNSLCNLKDKRNADLKRNVVYQVNCNDCDAKYIGETGRNIKIRMSEHQRDINNHKISNNMFQHVDETSHTFDLNNVKNLHSEKNMFPRKFIDAVHSKNNKNSINRAIEMSYVTL